MMGCEEGNRQVWPGCAPSGVVSYWGDVPRRERETQVRSLGQEDPLEKEMATHFSMLVWEIPQMEEPGWLQSTGSQRFGEYD